MESDRDLDRPLLAGLLSGNHRRVISVRLRALEEACVELGGLSRPIARTLTVRSPLPPAITKELDHLLSKLTDKIAEMNAELDLQRARTDPEREASALVASMMVNVEELHPRYLKGYGAVPEPLAEYLGVRLKELLQTLREIARVLRRASSAEDPRG